VVLSAPRVNQAKERLLEGNVLPVRIASVGTAVPPGVLTNADLERMVETSDEWITERTGIRRRHIAEKGTTCSQLATEAAQKALAAAGVAASDVDMILVATITPDMMLPATACLVQHNLGAKGAWGYDISAACSGFLYALQTGAQFVATGRHKNVLIIGLDVMSTIIDYTDRQTCIIFGDGGGAALLQPSDNPQNGCFIDFLHEVDGSGGDYLCVPGGGSKHPTSHETVDNRLHYVHQDGKAVFKFATLKMSELCQKLLERNGLTGKDVDVFIPHQANKRIIHAAMERIEIPEDRVIINIDQFGNTTAGTLPLAMNSALEQHRLRRGDLVLMASMGAGFTAGAALFRY
jgi:3-oxoacyl-[acyl-carrier-protein] synthase-3